MCAFSNIYNYSFKWITCLVVTVGAYTFLHWFLATPLMYSHFHDCCHEKWPRNRFVWVLLAISFASWLLVSVCIILIWCCLGNCKARRLNQPNRSLTNGKSTTEEGIVNNDSSDTKKGSKIKKNGKVETTEILTLPEFSSKGSFTIIQMNDIQPNGGSVGGADVPIPADEHLHYVQNEPSEIDKNESKGRNSMEKTSNEVKDVENNVKNINTEAVDNNKDNKSDESDEDKPADDVKSPKSPLKTPREIFFQDLIEAAANSPNTNSYFDFDPSKLTENILKKYEKENPEKNEPEEENTFFVGSHKNTENVTSEVFIALDEKGLVVDKPVKLGQFEVLKK